MTLEITTREIRDQGLRNKFNTFCDSPTFTGTVTMEDLNFSSGGGIAFAEIWVKDNATVTTLNSSGKTQYVYFNNNGNSNNMTPDHTNDHITIDQDGISFISCSIAIENDAPQAHTVNVGIFINNAVTQLENVHGHRNLAAGGGDRGSISMTGTASLSAGDTVELWASTDAAADRDVILEDVNLCIFQIGTA